MLRLPIWRWPPMLDRSKPALRAAASAQRNTTNFSGSKRSWETEQSMRERRHFRPRTGGELPQVHSVRRTKIERWKREAVAEKSARAKAIAARLAKSYPQLKVPLAHRNTFELLISVILSAQCTDEAVNKVTPELFRRYPNPEKLAQADIGAMEQLTKLAGVGRKTANVILGHAFDIPGIIVDTHCKRLSRRLGLTREQDPTKIERDLGRLLPPAEWTDFSHRLIIHGRKVCYARKPACGRCVLNELCPSAEVPGI